MDVWKDSSSTCHLPSPSCPPARERTSVQWVKLLQLDVFVRSFSFWGGRNISAFGKTEKLQSLVAKSMCLEVRLLES